MLTRDDLYNLEAYARVRDEFRAKAIAHKKRRAVELGAHASIHFEDELTIRRQVQETLRLERIYEPDLIQKELDAYNPLIADGTNWKATLLFEHPDADERREALQRLVDAEKCVYVQVGDFPRVTPFADEDLDRADASQGLGRAFPAFRADAGNGGRGEGGRADPRRRRPPSLPRGNRGAASHARLLGGRSRLAPSAACFAPRQPVPSRCARLGVSAAAARRGCRRKPTTG